MQRFARLSGPLRKFQHKAGHCCKPSSPPLTADPEVAASPSARCVSDEPVRPH
jgi:hypothetical protein